MRRPSRGYAQRLPRATVLTRLAQRLSRCRSPLWLGGLRRYKVPRVAFINKLDRQGANPYRVTKDIRNKLRLNAAMVQVPLGLEERHAGVVDLVTGKAFTFEGPNGAVVTEVPIPDDAREAVAKARAEMIERVAEVDEALAEAFLAEAEITPELVRVRLRLGLRVGRPSAVSPRDPNAAAGGDPTHHHCPQVCAGLLRLRLQEQGRAAAAGRCVGAKPACLPPPPRQSRRSRRRAAGVVNYLPNPTEKQNMALDRSNGEAEVTLVPDPKLPLVALAFKLEESRFGQLTYMRLYQGTMRRGDNFFNVDKGERVKIPRLVRMHANNMEDIEAAGAGEILATFGVECATGHTFTDGTRASAPLLARCHRPSPRVRPPSRPANALSQSTTA